MSASANAPILADVDMAHRAAKAMCLVVAHEAVDEGAPRHQLHLRIERGANREAALIELLFAVAVVQLAAHLLGEKAGLQRVRREHARIDAKRLRLGFVAIGAA